MDKSMAARLITWLLARLTPVLLALLAGAILLAGVQTVRFHQKTTQFEQFRRSTADIDLAREQEYSSNLLRARQAQQKLTDAAEQTRRTYEANLRTLNNRHAAVAAGLRNRPDRPTAQSLASAPAACTASCGTGAGLYRPDADVALWFAASAAKHAIERDACYLQYNHARQALSETP
jgi:hypothetical protein